MQALRSPLTQANPRADQLYEPPPCSSPFSTVANGQHHIWGGCGRGVRATTINSFDPLTEQWTLKETLGPPHPGLYSGECASIGSDMYMFGGHDGSSYNNDLSILNIESLEWTKQCGNNSTDVPMTKTACGLVAVDEATLCCFGGCGVGLKQPGSTFTKDSRYSDGFGWTNECHLFNTREGMMDNTICY